MATYFFDTSALAKRYIQETGSSWVSQICEDEDNNSIFISELTEIELVSAICRRAKGGTLTSAVAQIAIDDFDADLNEQYFPVEAAHNIITVARRLVESYALRGYDAVQLAAAIECNRERIFLGPSPITFVTSDNELLDATKREGLTVEKPNNYS